MKSLIESILPPLNGNSRKGDAGRVLVVGGSLEYTGAPYFAAMAAMKMGVDLAHIICHAEAGTAIKSYSPDLIVHPLISPHEDQIAKIFSVLDRVDTVIVGPGLSRDHLMQHYGKIICLRAIELGLPLVLDGDGIDLLIRYHGEQSDLLKRALVITPNHRELKRLCDFYKISDTDLKKLSKHTGEAVIVSKSHDDTITDGQRCENATEGLPGCPKRCGGQGDILAGCIGAYLAWNQKAITQIDRMDCCIAACRQVRRAASACYSDNKRSMLASDMLKHIGNEYE